MNAAVYCRLIALILIAASLTRLLAQTATAEVDLGLWLNANRQWFENDKNLATAFALLALSHCDDEAK